MSVAEALIRQAKYDLENYDPDLEHKRRLKRRMKFLFDAFTQVINVGAADSHLIWSLLCTDVLLRSCRDIVAFRSQDLKHGVPLDHPATVENNLMILANLKIDWCEFFKPIGVETFEQLKRMEPNSFLESCLKRQILEREQELVQFYCSEVSAERVEEWFAGMPQLVQHFVKKSSGSAGEPRLKKLKK